MNRQGQRRWHHNSVFGTGPRRPLTDDARRTWLAMADRARRAGRLTALHVEVGRKLLRMLGTDGRLDPSHQALAAFAGCGERTVRRALDALSQLGLVRWVRRIVRAGWRTEQTSNGYELLVPPALCCDGQDVRQTRKKDSTPVGAPESAPLPLTQAALEAQVALASIARERLTALCTGLPGGIPGWLAG